MTQCLTSIKRVPGVFASATNTMALGSPISSAFAERESGRFRPVLLPHRRGARASRKPRLLFVLAGVFLFRYAARQFSAALFQLPPRITRFEPFDRLTGS